MFDESFFRTIEEPLSPAEVVEGAVVVDKFENLLIRGNIIKFAATLFELLQRL
jgi:hypothetical protein